MFIDGDFFESLSDISFGDPYTKLILPTKEYIEYEVRNIEHTPILYIDTNRLPLLLRVASTINRDFKIITHNSDTTFDDVIIKFIPKNVISVWCQNYTGIDNKKIKPLPIGLERKLWFPEQKKQNVIINNMNSDGERINKIYMNFSPNTNPIRRDWFNHLKDKSYVDAEMLGNGSNYESYISNLKKYKFVVSPPGNGIDCHRNWECLYVGAIPIIKKSNFTIDMFSDTPAILVGDYDTINEDIIENYNGDGSLEKLTTDYWENKIKSDVK